MDKDGYWIERVRMNGKEDSESDVGRFVKN